MEDEILETVSLNCWNSNEIFQDGGSLTDSIKFVSLVSALVRAPNKSTMYLSVIRLLLQTETKGVTGPMKFNNKGERTTHLIEVLSPTPGAGNRNILGIWDPENKMNLAKNRSQLVQEAEELISNRTFIVATVIGAPYLQKCESNSDEETNSEEQCYEGFSKSLLDEMAKEGKFKYKFKVETEPGSPDPVTGKWTGMIKEIRERVSIIGL